MATFAALHTAVYGLGVRGAYASPQKTHIIVVATSLLFWDCRLIAAGVRTVFLCVRATRLKAKE